MLTRVRALQPRDLVFCRVQSANKDMEAELSCVDGSGKAAGMGLVSGGTLLEVSLGYARRLLRADCPILTAMGQYVRGPPC